VLRTDFVEELEHGNAITALTRALRNAVALRKCRKHRGAAWCAKA